MNKGMVLAWLLILLTGIAAIFWRTAWVYALPTPVPTNYHPIVAGAKINWPARSRELLPSDNRPLLLHFFNPDCPCSRFNVPHFRDLVKQYGAKVSFALILMTDKDYSPDDIRHRFDLPGNIPVIRDSLIAVACGVYSTPQAVVVDTSGQLFFRGNYNRSRYCTDEKTSYARQALESLLHHEPHPTFDPLALKAYGCKLPTCTQ
ncbi:MAG TPA: hypothetical protein VGM31_03060 [Puia sp.]